MTCFYYAWGEGECDYPWNEQPCEDEDGNPIEIELPSNLSNHNQCSNPKGDCTIGGKTLNGDD